MRTLIIIFTYCLFACSGTEINSSKKQMLYTETEILEQLDLAFHSKPTKYFPSGKDGDIKYNFFLDLEHGYCETAGNRIHLYADSSNWMIVFEKSGYENRSSCGAISLVYVGNCIDYPIDKTEHRNYISNSSIISLIDPEEFERIENKEGTDMETFELIGQNVKEIKVHNKIIQFDNNYKNYEKVGIKVRENDNPKNLIGFGDLIRYLHETNPKLISATEVEILKHFKSKLPKLMTIEDFHYLSIYDMKNLPSNQETFKLIAKVLVTKDTLNWKPTLKANNSWKNWESGHM